jgi:hypothetical protein
MTGFLRPTEVHFTDNGGRYFTQFYLKPVNTTSNNLLRENSIFQNPFIVSSGGSFTSQQAQGKAPTTCPHKAQWVEPRSWSNGNNEHRSRPLSTSATQYLFDQFPGDWMELLLEFSEHTYSEVLVDLRPCPENRPAKFHASFDDPRSIVTNNPLDSLTSEGLRRRRRRIL